MIKGFIFDLDGVLVDTPKLHFAAWRKVAHSLGFDLNESQYEELKGLNREASLIQILDWGNTKLSSQEFNDLMVQKNEWYLEMTATMISDDALPGVHEFLKAAKDLKLKIGLGSASQNARKILDQVKMTNYFDVIIDGTQTTKSKPDPQVFEFGAKKLNLRPSSIVVFEDSKAGIKAAIDGGFKSVGIGARKTLTAASVVYKGLHETSPLKVIEQFNFKS
ncbi:beta-phosphoglucomutase [Owenweeksia hongkongensis]|uniref:beta-phosphoglucomutase n=1 Tax=Owenweeksia hongkongensis TaxID=253245 RepID=UPI003A93C120